MEVAGKVAVVTGGASGIGRGMVRALSQRGMKVVVADRDAEKLAETVAAITAAGGQATSFVCDVADLDSVQALADHTIATYGEVNVLCNNAGVGLPTPVSRMKLADWKWMIDVDLWGPIHGMHVFLPLIESAGEGHICSTASMAGLISASHMGAYSVAKHGVVALMAAAERELRAKQSGVHTSVLCPGAVNTSISFTSMATRPAEAKKERDATKSRTASRSIQASLEEGMDPDAVGEMVADAIRDETFWILTHPEMNAAVQKQTDAMINERRLTGTRRRSPSK